MTSADYLDSCYRGVKVLVLGASGFIGRWVAKKLCSHGAELYLVARNSKIAKDIFTTHAITGEILSWDLSTLDTVDKLFDQIRPATTFNLTAYGVDRSQRDEKIAYQINTHLVQAICEAITGKRDRNWRGQDVVHVGSAFEYGAISGNLSENSQPNPTTLYGKSKLAGTHLLIRYCRAAGIKGMVARVFTVYGPGERQGRLLPSLLEVAKRGNPLQMTAGEQKRDFIYVGDVAEGLLRLGMSAALPGAVVNLATGRLTSIRRFAETAAGILGIPNEKLRFGSIPNHYQEMEHAEVELKLLRQLTSWLPPTEIVTGLRQTIEFCLDSAMPDC